MTHHRIIHSLLASLLPSALTAQQLNPATLTSLTTGFGSEARVALTHEQGGWTNYGQGSWLHTWDATAHATLRLDSATVVSGLVGYASDDLHGLTGSTWMDATHRPFDIVEATDTNAGDAHRDTYRLLGAVAHDVGRWLTVGAKANYEAANLAKYKDLRHKNKLMRMGLTAGLTARPWPGMALGAHYRYDRETESVTYSVYGKTDRTYQSLISYGAMMGQMETFGSTGLTESGREQPFLEQTHSGGLTAIVMPAARWQLTIEGEAGHLKGYYGRPSPYTIVFMRHKGDHGRAALTLRYAGQRHEQQLVASIESRRTSNDAQSYRSETDANGATRYAYYAPVKTGVKRTTEGYIGHEGRWAMAGGQPRWTTSLGLALYNRRQSAIVYPYYRRQQLHSQDYRLSAARHLRLWDGRLSMGLEASFKHGGGTAADDGTYAEPSDKQSAPASMATWLMHEYAWLTQAQRHVGFTLRYEKAVGQWGVTPYAELKASHRHANGTVPAGMTCDRTQVALLLGCTF